jgi:protein-L-isoaspartate(D-aspartate) O-methyltransferase
MPMNSNAGWDGSSDFMDLNRLRDVMVEEQLIPRGIRDARVLSAMRKIPRHLFLDESMWYRAYDDMALPIGEGQTMSQPYMVAIMTELLDLKGKEKVLEIGTGSGYQGAVLAELAREVFSIERIPSLSERAMKALRGLGYENIHFRVGDGTVGWPEKGPFDRIMITAGTPEIPQPLIEQLSEGGIIVAPVGDRFSQQLVKSARHKKKLTKESFTPCVFVPLVGEHGWKSPE